MPAQELDCMAAECSRYGESLRQTGRLIAAERLQSTGTATTLRMANGKVSVTDGPFAETKEQLAGFYLIEAGDREGSPRHRIQDSPGAPGVYRGATRKISR